MTRLRILLNIYTFIFIYICTYMCIYIYVVIHLYIYISMCIYIYIYIYLYTHTHIHIFIYIYNQVEETAFALTRTPYSATFLNQFVESAYKTIDSSFNDLQQAANDLSISDPGNQAVLYLRMITQFEGGGFTVKRSKALQKLMKSAVLWDLNTVGRYTYKCIFYIYAYICV
jgi:hypothetical protein